MNKETQKQWLEFQDRGLLFAVNTFLHMFGYAIYFEYEMDSEGNRVFTNVRPGRCRFRGFGEQSIDSGFKRLHTYLKDNIEQSKSETYE